MMKQVKPPTVMTRLLGYLAIPHELLHVVGYRLAGRRCTYHWGNTYVTPANPMPLWAQLIGTLFPFAVFALIFLVSTVLGGWAYGQARHSGSYVGFILWTGLAVSSGGYAGTAVDDLRQVYLLLWRKPWHSWTPFDFFYWPLIDWSEVRQNLVNKEGDENEPH